MSGQTPGVIATESGREAQARWETDIDREIEPGDPLGRGVRVTTRAVAAHRLHDKETRRRPARGRA